MVTGPGESTAQDMYAAIDALIDKLDRTILKHKEKNLAHAAGVAAVSPRFLATDAPERFARVGEIFLGRKIPLESVEQVVA